MNYDIAIGRCTAVDADSVVVRIDGAMLVKLHPPYVFKGPTKALLKAARAICSKSRPPVVDAELYIDRDATLHHPEAFLDLNGDDSFVSVDLRALLDGLSPNPNPVVASKPRASDFPNTLKRRTF